MGRKLSSRKMIRVQLMIYMVYKVKYLEMCEKCKIVLKREEFLIGCLTPIFLVHDQSLETPISMKSVTYVAFTNAFF